MNNHAKAQRLPQESDATKDCIREFLTEAAAIASRVLRSIQAIAGTTTCKGVQISNLEKWSHDTGCWIDDISEIATFSDRGSENEVYMSNTDRNVYKLNDFRYSDDNLTPFFDRIKAHNYYFADCKYDFIGMSRNKEGKICAVLKQAFIEAEREATEQEIEEELERLGFHSQYDGECFSNGEHDIYDALPNNVLIGRDGNLYFIDTIIYKSSADTINSYKSQSPRFNNIITTDTTI